MKHAFDATAAVRISTAYPFHISAVPNGHRRKANELGIPLEEAYVAGAMKALEMADWARECGAKHFTLFGMSCENKANRSKEQIDALIAGALWFTDHIGALDCNVHVFGKLDEFEEVEKYRPLYERLRLLQERKHDPEAFTIHIAANYSGMPQHELRHFMEALRTRGFAEVEQAPEKYLLSGGVPPVDLFIRTGGEYRISGFMPFQTAYAELCILDKLWLDVTEEDFRECLRWFANQKRNFGK